MYRALHSRRLIGAFGGFLHPSSVISTRQHIAYFSISKKKSYYETTQPDIISQPNRYAPVSGGTNVGGNFISHKKMHDNVDNNANKGVFVSSYYQTEQNEVEEYLRRKNLVFKNSSDKCTVMECPMCHPTYNRPDNQWKLTVYKSSGSFNCFRCGSKGSFFDLKKRLGDNSATKATQFTSPNKEMNDVNNHHDSNNNNQPKYPTANEMEEYSNNLENYPEIIELLTGTDRELKQRGLNLLTLKKYRVGVAEHKFQKQDGTWEKETCISFPWTRLPIDGSSNIVYDRVKLRSVKNKGNQRILPAGGEWGFFGWHTIPTSAKEIVITEGEYDAMAVYQATKRPAISLPNGARSLPPELLPCLERFEKIYLWMDNDKSGSEGAEVFCKKLGIGRTFLVRPENNKNHDGAKDANEALLKNEDLDRLILRANVLPHEQIVSFKGTLRNEVYAEFSEIDKRKGVQSLTLPSLNKYLKGHRRGELTIVTGSTGIGKTTILSQISLDFCQQGVTTLWGSFELKLPRLCKTMISQFAAKNFAEGDNLKEFDYWADKFEDLPLHFMRFFGSTSVEQVLDALEYAVYVHDLQHVVLDNLQFMLSSQMLSSRGGFEKWDIQDRAIDLFRQFATRSNVHVTLVIHPRKERDSDSELRLSSVFGTAKATQEADNVLIIQSKVQKNNNNNNNNNSESSLENGTEKVRQLEVRKNRFDGDCGTIPFTYDRNSCRIIEIPKKKPMAPHNFKAQ